MAKTVPTITVDTPNLDQKTPSSDPMELGLIELPLPDSMELGSIDIDLGHIGLSSLGHTDSNDVDIDVKSDSGECESAISMGNDTVVPGE